MTKSKRKKKPITITKYAFRDFRQTIKKYGFSIWLNNYTYDKPLGDCDLREAFGQVIKVRITIEELPTKGRRKG